MQIGFDYFSLYWTDFARWISIMKRFFQSRQYFYFKDCTLQQNRPNSLISFFLEYRQNSQEIVEVKPQGQFEIYG